METMDILVGMDDEQLRARLRATSDGDIADMLIEAGHENPALFDRLSSLLPKGRAFLPDWFAAT